MTIVFSFVFLLNGCHWDRTEILISDIPSAETRNASADDTDTEQTDSISGRGNQLAEGLFIEELFSYSGKYVEDGSNVICEQIAAVRIVNDTDTSYSYLRFSVNSADKKYTFTASTVLADSRMTVLNEEQQSFSDNKIVSCEIEASALFSEEPTVYPDVFSITYIDHFINITNLTDQPIRRIYVYYKNVDAFGLFGGITYRSYFDEIEAGQTLQNRVDNIFKDTSVVLFVTYEH